MRGGLIAMLNALAGGYPLSRMDPPQLLKSNAPPPQRIGQPRRSGSYPCPGCGRTISGNKAQCAGCAQ